MVPPVAKYYWSDSMVSLSWIRSDAERWGVFVKNRVKEIQKLTDQTAWNHCPGSENPADLPSRGTSAVHLKSDLRLHGPPWLRLDSGEWPRTQPDAAEPSECVTEARKLAMPAQVSGSSSAGGTDTGLSGLVDAELYSSLSRLLRVTAWVLRWIHNAKGRARRTGPLSSSEISAAEKRWAQQAQLDVFGKETATLSAGRSVETSSKICDNSHFSGTPAIISGITWIINKKLWGHNFVKLS